jgi:predicted nucleotidyltransferase
MVTLSAPTPAASRLRAALLEHGARVSDILERYGAAHPRVFGSVARGDARDDSDVDLLVDLLPGRGNELMRVAGMSEELSILLGVRVYVVAADLLRREVSVTALADAVAV